MVRKIAPTLNGILSGAGYNDDGVKRARRELRALLAVARAAAKVLRADDYNANTEVPTNYWGALKELRLAKERLDKLGVSDGR
jgi:hypothetical protein